MSARALRFPLVAGVALAVVLRVPWWGAPLSRDEGGLLMIAGAWDPGEPFSYGPYFVDRPPILVLLHRLAGDRVGLRILGAVAAALLVVVVILLAARLAGRTGAWVGGIVGAALVSSAAVASVFSPAELLAAVPAAASVLLLVSGLQRTQLVLLAGAGVAAAAALLVKQSFFDAGIAGIVGLAAAAQGVPARQALRQLGAYAAGVALVLCAVVVWQAVEGLPASGPRSLFYALFEFRLDAVDDVDGRWSRLGEPLLASGLVLALPAAIAGLALARQPSGVRPALLAWLLAGAVGVAAGGSYWPHYLIALVAPAAVGLALLADRRSAAGLVAVGLVVCAAAGWTVRRAMAGDPDRHERFAVIAGEMVRKNARSGDTAYALYAKANALAETGLRSPFPYHWSLMMQAVPGAESELRSLLASPRRPTWILQWQSTTAFGLDVDRTTKALLATHYRSVGRVCGHRVLLARSAEFRPIAPLPACDVVGP